MKKIILISLSIAALSIAVASPIKAETRTQHLDTTAMNFDRAPANSKDITPFNLVSRAYQGVYLDRGISGFGTFASDAANHKITAEILVQAAIDAKELSPQIQTDRRYLNAVTSFLNDRSI